MANVLNVLRVDHGNAEFFVLGTITLSGSYVQVSGAGEVLDFTQLTFAPGSDLPASKAPVTFAAWGTNGYSYGTAAWTNLQNKLKICTASNTELAAGAYPAGITGDTIFFEAVFDALL